jgi:transposase InsO family protein
MAGQEIPMSVRLAVAQVDAASIKVSAFCRLHGISRPQFYEIRRRFEAEGVAGLEPRSRAPKRTANKTPVEIEDRIVTIRKQLCEMGVDAGPVTIHGWLVAELPAADVPSESTVWRILVRRGFVEPEPRKAPRKRWRRFAAERANECWQMDSTGYPLASGTIVDIISVLDDCSRLAADGLVVTSCNTNNAWRSLERAAAVYGWPQRLLRDNAREFKAHNERLAAMGVTGRHSRPYHPQTCGKVERYQQTLKQYLDANGPYRTIAALQRATDTFRDYYNHHRRHRAIDRRTPAAVWASTPKSGPSQPITTPPATRVHTVKVMEGRIRIPEHRITLGIRYEHQHATVLITGNNCHVFIDGHLVRELTINPNNYDQPLHHQPGRPTP